MSRRTRARRTARGILWATLALAPAAALALSSDREQPIHIEADSVEIDDVEHVSTYTGNVRYEQGTIRLTAQEVTLYYDENRELKRFQAEGDPAKFRQRPDGQEEDMRAHAALIEYFAATERIVLRRNAHVWHQGNEFAGDLIEYDAADNMVKARKAESGEDRVQVIIQPKQNGKSRNQSQDGPDSGADAE